MSTILAGTDALSGPALYALLRSTSGDLLDLQAHRRQFRVDYLTASRTGRFGFGKLEAGQRFQEPDSIAWRAFADGRVRDALAENERRRDELTAYAAQTAAAGIQSRRARVVTGPLDPYLLWELDLLRIRDELGLRTRVIDLGAHPNLGRPEDYPEVVTIGDHLAYWLLYSPGGLQTGSVRFDDPGVIRQAQATTVALYDRGEPVSDFFARKVAPRLQAKYP